MRQLLAVLCITPVFVGCQQTRTADVERRLAAAEANAKSLQLAFETLKADYAAYKSSQAWDDMMKARDVAYLTPGSDGYSVIESNLGAMTVSLQDIRPYANGSRISLRFGNVTSATIDGLKAKVEWGNVDDKGMPVNDSTKSREVTFSSSLKAGTWTNIPVILEGTPPTALGFVRVRDLSHSGIQLFVK